MLFFSILHDAAQCASSVSSPPPSNSTSTVKKTNPQGLTKVSKPNPLGFMNVYINFHFNPRYSWSDIWGWRNAILLSKNPKHFWHNASHGRTQTSYAFNMHYKFTCGREGRLSGAFKLSWKQQRGHMSPIAAWNQILHQPFIHICITFLFTMENSYQRFLRTFCFTISVTMRVCGGRKKSRLKAMGQWLSTELFFVLYSITIFLNF